MVSTARQKSRLPSGIGKSKKAWKRYEEIVASITPCTQGSPSADKLFDFMFTTDKVSSQIAEESENLLTRIMQVVNGMIAAELFEHLPGDELVEENQAFRNVQGAGFLPAPGMGTGRAGEAAA